MFAPKALPPPAQLVLATQPASAIRYRPTTLNWHHNGIIPRMQARLTNTLPTLATWLGGHLPRAKAGSQAFPHVQLALTMGKGGRLPEKEVCCKGQHLLCCLVGWQA